MNFDRVIGKARPGTIYWVDDQLRPVSVGTSSNSITRDCVFLGQQRYRLCANMRRSAAN
jgi:hypothetical protein